MRSMVESGQKKPNLYLIGFMGTGKSSIGRGLASRLDMTFIDSDHAIEENEGRSIPDIFASEGEAHFRKLEKAFVENGHPDHGCIVACGGGLVTQPGMIDAIKSRGLVACLFAKPETILSRTAGNRNRPLLNVDNPEEKIRKLMAEREKFYLQAGLCMITDHRSMLEVISHLERYYQRESKKAKRSE
ncbi:shikimate kinase [Rubellicoccus peritrichatus]|uniref:Shikimate kinase n=1 Tax=Rubellicoccus peritrichatus TaxID=3080537 RepID=A0AAQ3LHW2_9BACT|nr:shikimate kinase [Puniceicoccus sp. CR14]WOO42379.1 shikimate kinase [Puniceicoccus sp. CR14]